LALMAADVRSRGRLPRNWSAASVPFHLAFD
jgi:hypothetical protein